MLDYLVRNACLPGENTLVDIAVGQGKIIEIATSLTGDAPVFEADGQLISCGFVESHLHLDKACILSLIHI